jgi:putative chitinase
MTNFAFTQDQLAQIIPNARFGVPVWYEQLNSLLPIFDITGLKRTSAFLAQSAYESGGYAKLSEDLNYKATTLMRLWPKRFPTLEIANRYVGDPEALANFVYASRMGNGDPATGDGYRYRGRGLFQLTGKDNYSKFAKYANIPVEEAPAYLETARGALHSALWFWDIHDLNSLADAGDMEGITQRVNGGQNGITDRIHLYNKITGILA